MPTRNVVITDHQAALLDRLVASGRYQNVSEAMRAGLRALEEDEARMDRLTARLDKAWSDADDRAPGTGEDAVNRAFAEAMRHYEASRE